MRLSLEERLAQMSRAGEGGQLNGETLSAFLESVSMLSKQRYPTWLLNRLQRAYGIKRDPDLLGVLKTAQEWETQDACWNWQHKAEGPPDLGHGFELMYQLLIEPFYLISLCE